MSKQGAKICMDKKNQSQPVFLLVMTASIYPSPDAQIERADPAVRLEDYKHALTYWLRSADPRLTRILFLENSGADLSPLRELVNGANVLSKSVEFLSTTPVAIPEGVHYGWGELKMLDEAFSRSELVKQVTHLIKVTGRFTFPGLTALLDHLPRNCEVMVDTRVTTSTEQKSLQWLPPLSRRILSLFPALLLRQRAYATTQLVIISTKAYNDLLLHTESLMKPGPMNKLEHLLFHQISGKSKADGVYLRFPVNCEPVGIGARRGEDYSSSGKKLSAAARKIARRFGLWL